MKLSRHVAYVLCASMSDRARVPSLVAAMALLLIMAGNVQADTTPAFVASGISAPLNGFVAEGSAINPATGKPFRHLWVSDHLRGLCRVDPDLETASALPPGSASINLSTCGIGGPVAYDSGTQKVYVADDVSNALNKGLLRQNFLPTGDGGHGTLDPVTTRLGDANSCELSGHRPSAMSQGPDGNLYIGFEHNGQIIRVSGPEAAVVPCAAFQRIGSSADGRQTNGLAWVDHTLYGLDGSAIWKIVDADRCATPSAPHSCQAVAAFAHFTPQAAGHPVAIGSNQRGSASKGTSLYIANIASVTEVKDPNQAARMMTDWLKGASLSNHASGTDNAAVLIPDVFIADESADGVSRIQGLVYSGGGELIPWEPAAPGNISATAGDGSAVVNWTPGSDEGTEITAYTVHAFIAPDLVHEVNSLTTAATPAPTRVTMTGLANGKPYVFKVTAANERGESVMSVNSNTVTPKLATQAAAPQNLTATASDDTAALAWQPPTSDGGSPITAYIIAYGVGDSWQSLTVPGTATGANITGLRNDGPTMVKIAAVNATGPGLDSRPVWLTPAIKSGSPDLALSMRGPTTVKFGGNAVYTLEVTNTGGMPVPQVRVDNILPGNGFASATFSTNQGSCLPVVGTTLTCNLGQMAAGQTGIVTVTLSNVTGTISNNASVAIYRADGVTAMTDSMPVDNIQAVTTSIGSANKLSTRTSTKPEPKIRKTNLPS